MPDRANVHEMFTNTAGIEATAARLAEAIAVEDDELARLEADLKQRKAALDRQKEQLCELMLSAGVTSLRCENGLNPQTKVERKYFKAAGVCDEQLFAWLQSVGLGAIIKSTVHHSTLQATVSEFVEQGGQAPEILQAVDRKTIHMGGKSKFLATRQ